MSTKIIVVYDNPLDPATFEAGYADQELLAQDLPGLDRIETSKVWPKEDGSPTPAYRFVELYFVDYATASAAVSSAQADAFFQSVYELASGGVRIAFTDVCMSGLLA